MSVRPDQPTPIPSVKCPRGHGQMEDRGEFHLPGPTSPSVESGGKVTTGFSRGIDVRVLVCPTCGLLELYDDRAIRGTTPRVRFG